MDSFRTTHPSDSFLKQMEELNTADAAVTPGSAPVAQKKTSVGRKSVHGGGSEFRDGEGEGGEFDDEETEGAGLIKDKRKRKQEERRLKKERRKKEVRDITQHF